MALFDSTKIKAPKPDGIPSNGAPSNGTPSGKLAKHMPWWNGGDPAAIEKNIREVFSDSNPSRKLRMISDIRASVPDYAGISEDQIERQLRSAYAPAPALLPLLPVTAPAVQRPIAIPALPVNGAPPSGAPSNGTPSGTPGSGAGMFPNLQKPKTTRTTGPKTGADSDLSDVDAFERDAEKVAPQFPLMGSPGFEATRQNIPEDLLVQEGLAMRARQTQQEGSATREAIKALYASQQNRPTMKMPYSQPGGVSGIPPVAPTVQPIQPDIALESGMDPLRQQLAGQADTMQKIGIARAIGMPLDQMEALAPNDRQMRLARVAETRIRDIDQMIKAITPAKRGLITGPAMPGQALEHDEHWEDRRRLNAARDTWAEIRDYPGEIDWSGDPVDTALQFGESVGKGFASRFRDPLTQVPFMGELIETTKNLSLKKIAEKIQKGTATPEELTEFEAYQFGQDWQGQRPQNIPYSGAQVAADIPRYAAEYAALKKVPGGGNAVEGMLLKGLRIPEAAVALKAGQEFVPATVGQWIKTSIATLASGAVMGAENLPVVAQNMTQRMVDDYATGLSPAGEVVLREIQKKGDGPLTAGARGLAQSMVEMGTESFGEVMAGTRGLKVGEKSVGELTDALKLGFIGKWLRKKGIDPLDEKAALSELRKMQKATGVQGLFSETVEEEVGEPLQALIDSREYKDPFSNPEGRQRLMTEIFGIAMFGIPTQMGVITSKGRESKGKRILENARVAAEEATQRRERTAQREQLGSVLDAQADLTSAPVLPKAAVPGIVVTPEAQAKFAGQRKKPVVIEQVPFDTPNTQEEWTVVHDRAVRMGIPAEMVANIAPSSLVRIINSGSVPRGIQDRIEKGQTIPPRNYREGRDAIQVRKAQGQVQSEGIDLRRGTVESGADIQLPAEARRDASNTVPDAGKPAGEPEKTNVPPVPAAASESTGEVGQNVGRVLVPAESVIAGKEIDLPTEKQKEAGNYLKPPVYVNIGEKQYTVRIETAKGTTRSGTDAKGNAWEIRNYPHDYGYVEKFKGADKEELDFFIGPDTESDNVFIINQKKDNGKFDEHKVMAGFGDVKAAEKAYLSAYDKNWKKKQGGTIDIVEMTPDEFNSWVNKPSKGPAAPASQAPTAIAAEDTGAPGATTTPLRRTTPSTTTAPSPKPQSVAVPIDAISIDTKRFQGRDEDYSEESVQKLMDAVDNGTFKWEKFDDLQLWKDPKDGKTYVLAGHSRLEFLKRMQEKDPGFAQGAPAQLLEGLTEKQAIKVAKQSNVLSTRETDLDRARYYREQRQAGTTRKEIDAEARLHEGKNAKYILDISHLNPTGAAVSDLKRLSRSGKENIGAVEKYAQWLGEARETYPELSDTHENEIYRWLRTGAGSVLRSNAEFRQRLAQVVEPLIDSKRLKPNVEMNIQDRAIRSATRTQYDAVFEQAKKDLKDAKDALEARRIQLVGSKTAPADIDRVLKPLNDAVTLAAQEYNSVRAQRDLVDEAEAAQGSIFDIEEEIADAAAGLASLLTGKENVAASASGQPGTSEFDRWFKGSKVVNEDGTPMVLYHGTTGDFDVFDPTKLGSSSEHPSAVLGFFASSDPGVADIFMNATSGKSSIIDPAEAQRKAEYEKAREYGYDDPYSIPAGSDKRKAIRAAGLKAYDDADYAQGANVMPVFFNVKNPYEVSWDEWERAVSLLFSPDMKKGTEELKKKALEGGYDGLHIAPREVSVEGFHNEYKGHTWVAFDNAQIKSATGNAGTFDASADITRSRGSLLPQFDIFGNETIPEETKETSAEKSRREKALAEKERLENRVREIRADIRQLKRELEVAPENTKAVVQNRITEEQKKLARAEKQLGDRQTREMFPEDTGETRDLFDMAASKSGIIRFNEKTIRTLDGKAELIRDEIAELQEDQKTDPTPERAREIINAQIRLIDTYYDQMYAASELKADEAASFAGPKSRTADVRQLGNAMARLEAGEWAENIRQESGWFKGADGKWRYEINDKDAELANLREGVPGAFYGHGDLGDFLNHDALFSAYPNIRNTVVTINVDPTAESVVAYFRAGRPQTDEYFARLPEISVTARTVDEALVSLLHETQHAIQHVEGFATGGNWKALMEEAEGWEFNIEVLNMAMSDLVNDPQYNDANGHLTEEGEKTYNEILDERNRLTEMVLDSTDPATGVAGYGTYRRLAGEVEARNVEARKNLPAKAGYAIYDGRVSGGEVVKEFRTRPQAEQYLENSKLNPKFHYVARVSSRESVPPSMTSDMEDKDVVVVFNGRIAANAPRPANARRDTETLDMFEEPGVSNGEAAPQIPESQPWTTPVDEFARVREELNFPPYGFYLAGPALAYWHSIPENYGKAAHFKTESAAIAWAQKAHKRIVREALDRGENVPASVLADYPDLEAKAKKKNAEERPKKAFDSVAWNKERDGRIEASRNAGNTHLDQVPPYVETMRGKSVYYVHDPKVRGKIRTVDNRGNVYIDWDDAYSAEKESASPVREGTGKKAKTFMRTSLGPSDLKDYVLADAADQPANSARPLPATIDIDGKQRPTTNSEGRAIAATEDEVRNFYRWFGDSKVVDDQGRPLVVYHGTADVFESFNDGMTYFSSSPDVANGYTGRSTAESRKAMDAYSAAEDAWAETWDANGMTRPIAGPFSAYWFDTVTRAVEQEEGLTSKAKAELRSLVEKLDGAAYDLRQAEDVEGSPNIMPAYLSLKNPHVVDASAIPRWDLVNAQAIEDATGNGDDGVIIKNVVDNATDSPEKSDIYVVFKNTQIKSATGNRGTFDTGDPDITHSRANLTRTQLLAEEKQVIDEAVKDTPDEFKQRMKEVRQLQDDGIYGGISDEIFIRQNTERPYSTVALHELGHRFWVRYAPDALHLGILNSVSEMDKIVGKPTADWIRDKYDRADWGQEMEAELFRIVAKKKAHARTVAHSVASRLLKFAPKNFRETTAAKLGDLIWGTYKFAQNILDAFGSDRSKYSYAVARFISGETDWTRHDPDRVPWLRRMGTDVKAEALRLGLAIWNTGAMEPQTFKARFKTELRKIDPAAVEKISPHIGRIYDSVTRAMTNVTGATTPQNLAFSLDQETRLQRWQARITDEFSRVKALESAITKAGGTFTDDMKIYRAKRLSKGITRFRLEEAEEKYITPLVDAIAKARDKGISYDEINLYLIARHADERNAEVARRNEYAEEWLDGGSGMTSGRVDPDDNEAQAIMDDYRQRNILYEVQRVARAFDAVTKQERDIKRKNIEGPEAVQAWEDMFRFYVPLRTAEGKESVGKPLRRGQWKNYKTKSFTGRKSLSDNPVEWAVAQLTEAVINDERNNIRVVLYNAAKEFPNPDVWEVDKVPKVRTVSKTTGIVREVADPTYSRKANVVTVAIEGVEHHIELTDPVMARQFEMMAGTYTSEDAANAAVRMLGKPTRWLTKMTTGYNPPFMFTNFVRDAGFASAQVLSRHGGAQSGMFLQSLPHSVSSIWRMNFPGIDAKRKKKGKPVSTEWFSYVDRFKQAGGQMGWYASKSIDDIQKDIERKVADINHEGRGIKKLAKWIRATASVIERANEAVELGTRVAYFRLLVGSGTPDADAALAAREITVDFDQKGEWGKTVNSIWAFSNAAIQGTVVFGRFIASPTGRKIAASVFGMSVAHAIAMRLAGGPDDEDGLTWYEKRSTWERESNVVIMIPGTEGAVLKFPAPHGLAFFWALGQIAVDASFDAAGKGVDVSAYTQRVTESAMSAFNPLGGGPIEQIISPTALEPFIQSLTNKTFMGSPVRPDPPPFKEVPDVSLEFRGVKTIPRSVARGLSTVTGGTDYEPGLIDVSPETVELYTDFVLGGVGKTISQAVNFPISVVQTLQGDTKAVDPRNIPGVSRFAGVTDDAYATRTKYYEIIKEARHIQDILKRMSPKERAEYHKENRNLVTFVQSTPVTMLSNQLSSLSDRMQKAADAGKYDVRDRLEKNIMQIQKRIIKRYGQTLGQEAP